MKEIPRDEQGRPRVYLEEDCPVEELGIECQREGGAGLHPPVNRLHVWWARRPLIVSRASVLGSLLPAGMDRKDFLALMGIPRGSDPVAGRRKIEEVKAGIRKERVKDPYGYPRAFTNVIKPQDISMMEQLIERCWGTKRPTVLDSFAGGGSIPFEAYRMGMDVILNELNPVASVIERATIEYPALFGKELAKDIKYWGDRVLRDIEPKLADCFPRQPGESDLCYIWTRTVECPGCQLVVPLSPNWWLDKKNKLGYQIQVPKKSEGNECSFKILNASSDFDPDEGSVTRGVGSCPRCHNTIEGDEIKRQAQEGLMGHQLAAIGFKITGKRGRYFREVTDEDLQGVKLAEEQLEKNLPEWKAKGLVPDEDYPSVSTEMRPINYGMEKWYKFFSSRQLLVHLTTLESILNQPWDEIKDDKKREAIRVYLAFGLDKGIDYNSIQCRLHSTRNIMVNTFDRHDFSFKWSYGEIDGAGQLQTWGVDQIVDAYKGLAKLISNSGADIKHFNGDAASLPLESDSVHHISIDPPYYDNVMYAECSDFFYVWQKRTLGDVFPELFGSELTDKDAETVANRARFSKAARGKARKLADQDYTAKMQAAFNECHRVLKDEGVLTIMFTHKQVDAWDSLARALLDAGFEITATWPIHTESEHSLHQAKKNAAASTILLVCRKRSKDAGDAWWDDIKDELQQHVRGRAEYFASKGLRGQDTSIACFGPALQIISRQWPVKMHSGEPIRPDEALDLARKEVNDRFFENIVEGKTKVVDNVTKFYILAWYHFQAREFPYDEARKLAFSVDVDIDRDLMTGNILKKKGQYVVLVKPEDRFRKGKLKADAKSYSSDIDYVHAAIHAYQTGQSRELQQFHQRTGALTREGYKHAIGYLLDVFPRTKEVSEYHTLDKLWEANFQDKISRKVPRRTDPTMEKQRRLEVFDYEKDE